MTNIKIDAYATDVRSKTADEKKEWKISAIEKPLNFTVILSVTGAGAVFLGLVLYAYFNVPKLEYLAGVTLMLIGAVMILAIVAALLLFQRGKKLH